MSIEGTCETMLRYSNSEHSDIALEAQSPPIALDAILGLARLQLRSGEAEQAYELAYFVLNHAPLP